MKAYAPFTVILRALQHGMLLRRCGISHNIQLDPGSAAHRYALRRIRDDA
ncbi:MAG TPA: hypothetical protein PKH09_01855 [Parvularculaceae bacterium]|nr:hypothetical protein [Parvularculaceae bacterium]